jgi:hypothetical protein
MELQHHFGILFAEALRSLPMTVKGVCLVVAMKPQVIAGMAWEHTAQAQRWR